MSSDVPVPSHTVPQPPLLWIVEDEPEIAELMQWALEDRGYRVVWYARGDTALAAIERQQPDLILLDLMLPGIDGRGVLHIVKSRPDLASIPVIVATAVVTALSDSERNMVAGILAKPFALADLVKVVESVLHPFRG